MEQNHQEINAYALLEVDVRIPREYENPYDPDEINMNAVFISPTQEAITVPAFWYEPFWVQEENEKIVSNGQGRWKVRFTPRSAGVWQYYVQARDRSGETHTSRKHKFQVNKPEGEIHGFIRMDTVHQQYFRYEHSGKFFFGAGLNSDVNVFNKSDAEDPSHGNWGIGSGYLPPWTGSPSTGLTPENLFQGYRYHTHMVQSLGENGGKAIRINTDRYYHPLEAKATEKPYDGDLTFEAMGFDLGKYNQAMCFILDKLYQRAEQYHIGVVHNVWDAVADQPYSAGFCYAEQNQEALIKRKLRYIVARWGYSTSYWMTEYFNELKDARIDAFWQGIIEWHKELDLYDHAISLTSATFGETGPDVYLENAYTDTCYKFGVYANGGMPGCLGEFGESYLLGTQDPMSYDPAGNWVRQTLWNALVSKWAGGFTWWTHPIYGEKGCNAYRSIYPALSRFLEQENLTEEGPWDTLDVRGEIQAFDHVRAIANEAKTKAFVWLLRTPPQETRDRNPLVGKHFVIGLDPHLTYEVEWWDSQTGEIITVMHDKKAADTGLLVNIPNTITRDRCVKIYASPSARTGSQK
jgi:hypothetical protein